MLQVCGVVESDWRSQWHPTPVLLPGKSHGWRSLVGCSPLDRYESDTTDWLHFHFSLSHIGEGDGNPLQCSCLENPRDGEPGGLLSMGSHRVGHNWSDSKKKKKSKDNCLWDLIVFYIEKNILVNNFWVFIDQALWSNISYKPQINPIWQVFCHMVGNIYIPHL